ncbi:MAG TPA: TolC family protein [Agriterribacter sp.]|nr:TolC family protein [Agriterribacter sp.]HRQ50896.1 TolC family protein [Agriterribacter sp.]
MTNQIAYKIFKFSYFIFPVILLKKNVTKGIRGVTLKLRMLPALLLCTGYLLQAQPVVKELSLNEAVRMATEQNKNISLSELDEKIALFNYKQTTAVYLPRIALSYTAMVSDNPLNAFGAKLQQRKITQADFNPQLLNHPSATPDFMTTLNVQQPILNIDQLYRRKSAFQQVALYQYKTQRSKEYIAFLAQQAYLQLQLAYEAKTVMEESLRTVRAIYDFTSDRYDQGLIQKSDVLNVDVQLKTAETGIAEAENNIKNASDYLSILMEQPPGTVYTTASFPSVPEAGNTAAHLSPGRSDFKAMETAVQSYNLMIKSSRMSYLPRLNAFGSYQLNDAKVAGFGANAYLAGLQLSWDLFNGSQTKNKILAQTAERDKLAEELTKQKSEAGLELSKTQRQLSVAIYTITQQETAVARAAEALRIIQNRYNQGLVNTTDVLTAQSQLSQQKLLYRQSVYSAHVTAAYLEFLTLQ